MFFILMILLSQLFLNRGVILHCDFDRACKDFIDDSNWIITDGDHPNGVQFDHTFGTNAGLYLLYQSVGPSLFTSPEIKTNGWILPTNLTNQGLCFQTWYYTNHVNVSFTVQIAQGDDERLTRNIASFDRTNSVANTWVLIKVPLPNEKFKLFIRLSTMYQTLAFDDMSVDYCSGFTLVPEKILYSCNFESSCSNHFMSLPEYPYQWLMLNASAGTLVEHAAPSMDSTFTNQSGHYALLQTSIETTQGKVGYLHLEKQLSITQEQSYCLNFQYYNWGGGFAGSLHVYAWIKEESKVIQSLWPQQGINPYKYTTGNWTWAIINLPMGNYSLLFRGVTLNNSNNGFALDDIVIVSCDYQHSQLRAANSFLSVACNFDDLSMCNVKNGDLLSVPTFNFTAFTGDTLPTRDLGPTRDHTTNTTSGGFLYWNRKLPFGRDVGVVQLSDSIEQNTGMCIRFSYYAKSSASATDKSTLNLTARGCYDQTLWSITTRDSGGWRTVTERLRSVACQEKFYFTVVHQALTTISIALDDVMIDQCSRFSETSTTATSSIGITTRDMKTTETPKRSTEITRSSKIPVVTPATVMSYGTNRSSAEITIYTAAPMSTMASSEMSTKKTTMHHVIVSTRTTVVPSVPTVTKSTHRTLNSVTSSIFTTTSNRHSNGSTPTSLTSTLITPNDPNTSQTTIVTTTLRNSAQRQVPFHRYTILTLFLLFHMIRE